MGNVIVIMGAPGAGKGTQSRLLSEKFNYPQIATGDILRTMAKADTSLGKEIKSTLAAGNLVSDEVLTSVILERTSQADCAGGYILDGFPRTLKQAELLENLVEKQNKEILLVRVKVPRDVLMNRLTGRRTCPQCGEIYNIHYKPPKQKDICDLDGAILTERADDNESVVSRRLETYIQSTMPLFNYYEASGRMVAIDGEQPVDVIFDQLSQLLSKDSAV
jgi:adenylate kinase